MNIVKQSVDFRWATPNAERCIEEAARLCYKSEGLINEDSHIRIIKKLLKLDHTAMLEHGVASVKFTCDRGISHEIVRHRVASYAQESTRYVNYAKADSITVICPPDLEDLKDYFWWEQSMLVAEQSYMQLIAQGKSPQIARSVLPTCTKTEIIMTTNFRSWRNFLRLRLPPSAHPQIREVARMVYDHLVKVAPTVFGDFQELRSV